MSAQSYQEEPASSRRSSSDLVAPRSVRALVVALVALIVVLLVLPVVMTIDRDSTGDSILRKDPSMTPAELDVGITVVLVYTWAMHVVYAAVATWLVLKCLKGRRWARIALTLLMVIASLNSLSSAAAGSQYYWPVIAGDVIHLAVIALLWLPKPSRAFFAAHRSVKSA